MDNVLQTIFDTVIFSPRFFDVLPLSAISDLHKSQMTTLNVWQDQPIIVEEGVIEEAHEALIDLTAYEFGGCDIEEFLDPRSDLLISDYEKRLALLN